MPVVSSPALAMSPREIEEFCARNHIRKFSFFGSILTDQFGPDSDIDVLVEFDVGRVPGYIGIARMESELTQRLGRNVDLRTPGGLSEHMRGRVIRDVAVQ